ncbi:hypothetical protein DIPPA_32330 [Diplonema papillatum]|nr:hypothetical protein DIPPA_32330 [Diplonema papillatum]
MHPSSPSGSNAVEWTAQRPFDFEHDVTASPETDPVISTDGLAVVFVAENFAYIRVSTPPPRNAATRFAVRSRFDPLDFSREYSVDPTRNGVLVSGLRPNTEYWLEVREQSVLFETKRSVDVHRLCAVGETYARLNWLGSVPVEIELRPETAEHGDSSERTVYAKDTPAVLQDLECGHSYSVRMRGVQALPADFAADIWTGEQVDRNPKHHALLLGLWSPWHTFTTRTPLTCAVLKRTHCELAIGWGRLPMKAPPLTVDTPTSPHKCESFSDETYSLRKSPHVGKQEDAARVTGEGTPLSMPEDAGVTKMRLSVTASWQDNTAFRSAAYAEQLDLEHASLAELAEHHDGSDSEDEFSKKGFVGVAVDSAPPEAATGKKKKRAKSKVSGSGGSPSNGGRTKAGARSARIAHLARILAEPLFFEKEFDLPLGKRGAILGCLRPQTVYRVVVRVYRGASLVSEHPLPACTAGKQNKHALLPPHVADQQFTTACSDVIDPLWANYVLHQSRPAATGDVSEPQSPQEAPDSLQAPAADASDNAKGGENTQSAFGGRGPDGFGDDSGSDGSAEYAVSNVNPSAFLRIVVITETSLRLAWSNVDHDARAQYKAFIHEAESNASSTSSSRREGSAGEDETGSDASNSTAPLTAGSQKEGDGKQPLTTEIESTSSDNTEDAAMEREVNLAKIVLADIQSDEKNFETLQELSMEVRYIIRILDLFTSEHDELPEAWQHENPAADGDRDSEPALAAIPHAKTLELTTTSFEWPLSDLTPGRRYAVKIASQKPNRRWSEFSSTVFATTAAPPQCSVGALQKCFSRPLEAFVKVIPNALESAELSQLSQGMDAFNGRFATATPPDKMRGHAFLCYHPTETAYQICAESTLGRAQVFDFKSCDSEEHGFPVLLFDAGAFTSFKVRQTLPGQHLPPSERPDVGYSRWGEWSSPVFVANRYVPVSLKALGRDWITLQWSKITYNVPKSQILPHRQIADSGTDLSPTPQPQATSILSVHSILSTTTRATWAPNTSQEDADEQYTFVGLPYDRYQLSLVVAENCGTDYARAMTLQESSWEERFIAVALVRRFDPLLASIGETSVDIYCIQYVDESNRIGTTALLNSTPVDLASLSQSTVLQYCETLEQLDKGKVEFDKEPSVKDIIVFECSMTAEPIKENHGKRARMKPPAVPGDERSHRELKNAEVAPEEAEERETFVRTFEPSGYLAGTIDELEPGVQYLLQIRPKLRSGDNVAWGQWSQPVRFVTLSPLCIAIDTVSDDLVAATWVRPFPYTHPGLSDHDHLKRQAGSNSKDSASIFRYLDLVYEMQQQYVVTLTMTSEEGDKAAKKPKDPKELKKKRDMNNQEATLDFDCTSYEFAKLKAGQQYQVSVKQAKTKKAKDGRPEYGKTASVAVVTAQSLTSAIVEVSECTCLISCSRAWMPSERALPAVKGAKAAVKPKKNDDVALMHESDITSFQLRVLPPELDQYGADSSDSDSEDLTPEEKAAATPISPIVLEYKQLDKYFPQALVPPIAWRYATGSLREQEAAWRAYSSAQLQKDNRFRSVPEDDLSGSGGEPESPCTPVGRMVYPPFYKQQCSLAMVPYEASVKGRSMCQVVNFLPNDELRFLLVDLDPESRYRVQTRRIVKDRFPGRWSLPVPIETQSLATPKIISVGEVWACIRWSRKLTIYDADYEAAKKVGAPMYSRVRPVLQWEVELSPADDWQTEDSYDPVVILVPGTETGFTFTDLAPETSYTVRLRSRYEAEHAQLDSGMASVASHWGAGVRWTTQRQLRVSVTHCGCSFAFVELSMLPSLLKRRSSSRKRSRNGIIDGKREGTSPINDDTATCDFEMRIVGADWLHEASLLATAAAEAHEDTSSAGRPPGDGGRRLLRNVPTQESSIIVKESAVVPNLFAVTGLEVHSFLFFKAQCVTKLNRPSRT